MTSKYQMYLTNDGKFRFPVLPEQIKVSYGTSNTKMKVCGVGEVTIVQDTDAAEISFSSFFPKTHFSGCAFSDIPSPKSADSEIKRMMSSKTPSKFVLSGGMGVSMYVTIESYESQEAGGDPGTIQFSIKLKEYREVKLRQIKVNITQKKAKVTATASRVDPRPAAKTYTVVRGDCLWSIARKFYGSGAKYTVIYNANKGVIDGNGGNPNLIYPGQVLTIPDA